METMTMSSIDLAELRRLTQEAVDLRQKRDISSAGVGDEMKEVMKAQEVIERIPYLCRLLANDGKRKTGVMTLEGNQFDCRALPQPSQNEKPLEISEVNSEWLFGVARIVWHYCIQTGLNPTLESWTHNGLAPMWGYTIIVHW
jgi:hypothetical protein